MGILELLKYTVPSGIVFVTAYFMLRQFFNEQRQVEIIRAKAAAKADVLPTRLQAYERLILLLERIEPSQLIPRVHRPAMSAPVFKRELQKTVREEFEHNLTQQLYVSSEAWKKVMESKDAVLQLIELASKNTTDTSTGIQLSSVLFEILSKAGISPTSGGIEYLKSEARQLI